MSLKEKAIIGIIWSGIQSLGITIINLIVHIVLARLIAPAEFGLIGIIMIFNALGFTLMESGISQSILRMKNPKDSDYKALFIINLSLSIFIYIFLYIIAPIIASQYGIPTLEPLIRVFALIIPIQSFQIIQVTKLTKELNFKLQAKIQIPALLISALIGISMGYLAYGVWALIALNLSRALVLSVLYWICGGYIPTGDIKANKIAYHFIFGYKLLLSGLLNTIHVNLYAPMIGKYYNPTQVGYFSRANSFSNIPINLLTSIFSKVTLPVLAEVQHNEEIFVLNFRKILKLILFIVSPIMCILFIISSSLIELLLTTKWLPMSPYFKWFAICGIFLPLHLYYLNVLKIKGRSDLFLKAEIIKVCLSIFILIITVQIGLMAVIYGILLSNFVSLFINQYFCRDIIKYNFISQWKDILIVVIPSISALILTQLTIENFEFTYNIIELIFSICIYLSIFTVINLIFNATFLAEIQPLVLQVCKILKSSN